MVLLTGALQAQSFLSRQYVVEVPAAEKLQEQTSQLAEDGETNLDSVQSAGEMAASKIEQHADSTKPRNEAAADEGTILKAGSAETVTSGTELAADDVRLKTEEITLQQISDLIDNGEHSHARALLEAKDFSRIDELPTDEQFNYGEWHNFLLMKARFLLGDYQAVVDLAPSYFMTYGNGKHYFLGYYYFAVALDHLQLPMQMVYLVTEDFFDNLSPGKGRNLRQLLINDALANEQPFIAYSFMLDSENRLISGFEVDISGVIHKIEDIADIEAILDEGQDEQVKSLAELRKVQLLIRDGAYEAAQDFLNLLFSSEDLDSSTLSQLQAFQSFIDIALNTDPYRIGVILPLSHKRFGQLARQVLDGLELALQTQLPGEQEIRLIVKDSARHLRADNGNKRLTAKERVALVQQQVRELIEEDRVIAILGPLAKNTSLAAGETAELYKVPIISFSITEEIGKDMPFLFRFQRNRIAEAENLARYALDYLGAERFVLFYPIDKSGKGYRVMQAFNRIVSEKGGTITGISPVEYRQVDYKNNYLSMTGGFRKKVELEEGEKKEEEDPIVDFDLMFAPVPLNALKIMLDFNRSFDAEKVWVLAGAEINVRENQLLSHTRRLRFIDAFPIGSIGTYLQPFYEEHWRSYNFRPDYRPPTSYTIYAYEALEIVSKLLNDPSHHNRESLRNAIQNLAGFPILTGQVSCDRNGELVKQLNILRIKAKKTVAVY